MFFPRRVSVSTEVWEQITTVNPCKMSVQTVQGHTSFFPHTLKKRRAEIQLKLWESLHFVDH